MPTAVLNVRVPAVVKTLLEAAAEQERVSLSDLVRQLLVEGLERRQAERRGE